ncbi:MAG: homoserine kinase [Limnospira sp. PMC 1291.21]|uniref:Homoserine kinase n=3 Tax=Limnospira TaxID=2596745 RepID=A0A9P1KBZ6_9CYAN|nr:MULTISPECIES: homoserine kinase [Limnospira]EKD10033.1 homoserine kinase [Arthrospira platensis C1]MDC0839807.1 homoserine kinase [Limnoraphis robusta]MDY7054291.1 homoserine kinase [Limnospira fusiformis LS22]QJB28473.1 homoserine kinase [Limnospira fusiformis SAG 85.79]EDZ95434.1 homoserine kinase [Limnospira maxima CS-328]
MSHPITVTVPATTANIGPGFDCIGAALSLYNTLEFSPLTDTEKPHQITAEGLESDRVATDDRNLVYQAFLKFYHHINQTPPPVKIHIKLGVPLARGLGSSATAIVGGLVGANTLAGNPLTPTEIMEMAIAIEGHPDNVVPALLGGCQLSVADHNHRWQICEIPWHQDIVPVVAIPDFELSTAEARSVLPSHYTRADAIFNTAHLGLLVRGLETGQGDWLRVAMADKIHQPYRQSLIQGYDTVRQAALDAGAYELAISGAGPTLLALTDPPHTHLCVSAMREAWRGYNIGVDVRSLAIDTQGAKVT